MNGGHDSVRIEGKIGEGAKMIGQLHNSVSAARRSAGAGGLVMLLLAASPLAFGDKKKKDDQTPQKPVSIYDGIDKSKIVWPQPPPDHAREVSGLFRGPKAS